MEWERQRREGNGNTQASCLDGHVLCNTVDRNLYSTIPCTKASLTRGSSYEAYDSARENEDWALHPDHAVSVFMNIGIVQVRIVHTRVNR
jgi:hypothetical protein